MVTPEPDDEHVGPTEFEAHVIEIQRALRGYYPKIRPEDRLRHVRSWEQFREEVSTRDYDLIYFYGHGAGDPSRSRLWFEDDHGALVEKPIASLADAICVREKRPSLIYVNCCQGDAGAMLGVGHQLSRAAACVVTNRTMALVDVARRQALAFWDGLLKYGQKPHMAASALYQQPDKVGVGRNEVHWFTPVVHANYAAWESKPVQPDREIDPHWDLNLDRIPQFGELTLIVRNMMREPKRKALAFIWFGEYGQGMQLFHERVEVKLENELQEERVFVRRPRWPESIAHADFAKIQNAEWEAKLREVFSVQTMNEVPAKLRSDAEHQQVILLSFPHVNRDTIKCMSPKHLLSYLEWWDGHVLQQFDSQDKQFILLFSFEAKKSDVFADQLAADYSAVDFHDLVVRRLPPLGSVFRQDVSDFLELHNVYIPHRHRSKILDEIIKKTAGHYETTLAELEQYVIDGYLEMDRDPDTPEPDDGPEY